MIKVDNKFYFVRTKQLNVRNFYKHMGIIPKTYMASIVYRLFEYFFGNAICLKKEYIEYYKKEFGTYAQYLSQKHNLFQGEIELFSNKNVYYKDLTSFPDLNLPEILREEDIKESIVSFEKEYTT